LLPGEGRTHIYSVLTMKEESSKRCLTRFKCPLSHNKMLSYLVALPASGSKLARQCGEIRVVKQQSPTQRGDRKAQQRSPRRFMMCTRRTWQERRREFAVSVDVRAPIERLSQSCNTDQDQDLSMAASCVELW